MVVRFPPIRLSTSGHSKSSELTRGSRHWPAVMASTRLRQASSDLLFVRPGHDPWTMGEAGKRMRQGFAAAVAIAGSLMISSTAPALLEGAGAGSTDIRSNVDSGLDGYAALFTGDPYRSADPFAALGAAPFSLTEAGYTSFGCDQSSEIDTTMSATGRSASASPRQEGICFGQHDAIEYFAIPRNPDRRSVDFNTGVPSTVRSHIVDNQLFRDRPAVVARSHSADASRTRKVSTLAKFSTAMTARTRRPWTLPPVGCSRCPAQVVQSSPRRAKAFAFLFPADFFRNVRSIRRERLPSGIARQREAPRVAAWNFRRV